MKIIIVGDGKVGLTLTEQLSLEGHELVVIDSNAAVLQEALETYDVMVVSGNGASYEVLKEAGAGEADLLIAATSLDEINLLSCITAKKMGCGRTIARVRNEEYKEQIKLYGHDLGISMTINPELAAAREIYHILQFPSSIKREFFAKSRIEIVELKVSEQSPSVGKSLISLYKNARIKVLVCAVDRDGKIYIPTGDFVLMAGDILYVTAETRNLEMLIKYLGIETPKIKDVLMIGGGQISRHLAAMLAHTNMRVEIIEQDLEKCQELAEQFPKALIVHGDGSIQKLLEREGIGQTDAVLCLTGIDEINIIISMYAKHMQVQKVITKIDRTEDNGIFKKVGMESIVCPKRIACNHVLRYVRAMDNREENSIRTLLRLLDGRVEALEFIADEDTLHLGVPLKNMTLREGVLIACITHNGNISFPGGENFISQGDTVIVISIAENRIKCINDIFPK